MKKHLGAKKRFGVKKLLSVKEHFRWGESFIAIMAEFSTPQIDELREHCEVLIKGAPKYYKNGYFTNGLPFEMHGYAFILERESALWTLEVLRFPAPAPKGKGSPRISAARREREKAQREVDAKPTARPERAKRPRKAAVKRILCILRSGWRQRARFEHKVSAIFDDVLKMQRGGVKYITVEYARRQWRVRAAEIAATNLQRRIGNYVTRLWRNQTTQRPSSGLRLERRLFGVDIGMPLILSTWTPIDPGFDKIWDISLYGVRAVESEWL